MVRCARCHRVITDPAAIEAGYGAKCYAKEFGKNHTTVLYALKKVEQELPNSSNGLQDNIRDITSNINSRL